MIFTWVSEQINQWLVNNTIYCCAGLRGYSLLLLIKASRFQIKVLLTLWCIRCLIFFFFFFFCQGKMDNICERFHFLDYAVHTIDNELEDSSLIRPVVQTSLALCSIVYVLTSFFGFLLFGDSTLDDVLANFNTNLGIPYGSLLNDVVRISYALHLMLVFPILFYPLRLNLDGLLFPSSRPLVLDNLRFGLISIGLLLLVFLGANFIPNIWDVFQFTGATATVCIGFIFPAAIALR